MNISMQHIKKNYSNMSIHTILCDIDGSLMRPSSGLYVDEEIAQKIIALEEKGMLVILNSARALSGVLPLSRQLKMDHFGGYVISCNGANIKDAKTNHTLFEYAIKQEDALDIWHTILNHQLIPGILQPDHMLALKMTEGYELDAKNCHIAYNLTKQPEESLKQAVWKCTASGTKTEIDRVIFSLKEDLEKRFPVKVVRSTDTFVDIIDINVDKFRSSNQLLRQLYKSWDEVSAIGDGLADLECMKAASYAVAPANAQLAVLKVADQILPSCDENGCLVWLDELLRK